MKRGVEFGDVELDYLHHRVDHPLRFLRFASVPIVHHLGRDDLPGDSKSVVEPTALNLLPAGAQMAPEVINLCLIFAGHGERKCVREIVTLQTRQVAVSSVNA